MAEEQWYVIFRDGVILNFDDETRLVHALKLWHQADDSLKGMRIIKGVEIKPKVELVPKVVGLEEE